MDNSFGGFDENFVNTLPDEYQCLVCHLALRDPHQITGCGHRFCKLCLQNCMR